MEVSAIGKVLAAGLAAVAWATAMCVDVRAATAEDEAICFHRSGGADRIIAACTAVQESASKRATLRDAESLGNALLQRAWAFQQKDEPDRALLDLNALVRLRPKDAQAYLARARFHYERKDRDRAGVDLADALRLYPKPDCTGRPGSKRCAGRRMTMGRMQQMIADLKANKELTAEQWNPGRVHGARGQ